MSFFTILWSRFVITSRNTYLYFVVLGQGSCRHHCGSKNLETTEFSEIPRYSMIFFCVFEPLPPSLGYQEKLWKWTLQLQRPPLSSFPHTNSKTLSRDLQELHEVWGYDLSAAKFLQRFPSIFPNIFLHFSKTPKNLYKILQNLFLLIGNPSEPSKNCQKKLF